MNQLFKRFFAYAQATERTRLYLIAVGSLSLILLSMNVYSRSVAQYNELDLQATAQAIAGEEIGGETTNGSLPAGLAEMPSFQAPVSIISSGIPRLVNMETIIPDRPRVVVTTYSVEQGDNLFDIASRFALQPETVLWGNYEVLQDNPQFLSPGQELNILPTDGVYYRWNQGDALPSVAEFFGVSVDDVLAWPGNGLDPYQTEIESPGIADGSWLIIPGGKRELRDWGPPAITRSDPASAAYYGAGSCGQIYEGAVGTNTFVWPTTQTSISGYDFNPSIHPGLDIAGAEGNAVYSVDSGVVVFAGWSEYGYGFLIVVDHGTGWQSAYAHLSGVSVTCGQSVAQGTVIGAVGNTGNSSGAHLHFELQSELYGKVSPWNYLSP
ncbi:MAG: peptidoglycan DD-metalloendopeptidase family protein [Chloroflexi bacterium]|nr:peptidoglycan DD-metalloendopeptidase family protein [Chloroflexota bacterium]